MDANTWWQSLVSLLQLWWLTTTDHWNGRAPKGARRSSRWTAVREAFLNDHPTCACCGGTVALEVHHIEPFHVRPELELEPSNLVTLCESGKHGLNCHLLLGHFGNWKRWNPLVRADALLWRAKLTGALTRVVRGKVIPAPSDRSALSDRTDRHSSALDDSRKN